MVFSVAAFECRVIPRDLDASQGDIVIVGAIDLGGIDACWYGPHVVQAGDALEAAGAPLPRGALSYARVVDVAVAGLSRVLPDYLGHNHGKACAHYRCSLFGCGQDEEYSDTIYPYQCVSRCC